MLLMLQELGTFQALFGPQMRASTQIRRNLTRQDVLLGTERKRAREDRETTHLPSASDSTHCISASETL